MRKKTDPGTGTGAEQIGAEAGTGTGTGKKRGTGTGTGAGKKKGTGKKGAGAVRNRRGTGKTGRVNKGYTMSETAMIQRRSNANVIPADTPEKMDYNARLIQHVINIQEIASHTDKKDPVSLRAAFYNYLALCQTDGFSIGNMAAYAAMGVTHKNIEAWLKSERTEYRELAQAVKTICSLSREQQISDGGISPVIGIFWQRNFDGLRNDTEQIQSTEATENENDMTAAEYKSKYGKLLEE